MNIKIKDVLIRDKWDYQKGKLLLEMAGLSGKILSLEQREYLEKEITKFLWDEIKKQFSKVIDFTTDRQGGFNQVSSRNFDTPIINIHGSFYMQVIGWNSNRNGWIWETVELEPFRFYFNEDGYFKGQVVEAINKLIMRGYNKKTHFHKLIKALNETLTSESVITIHKRTAEVKLHNIPQKLT